MVNNARIFIETYRRVLSFVASFAASLVAFEVLRQVVAFLNLWQFVAFWI